MDLATCRNRLQQLQLDCGARNTSLEIADALGKRP